MRQDGGCLKHEVTTGCHVHTTTMGAVAEQHTRWPVQEGARTFDAAATRQRPAPLQPCFFALLERAAEGRGCEIKRQKVDLLDNKY